jgi:hypothetical protein
MFTVKIRTRGAAFSNNQGSLRSIEVAGLLRGIALGLERDEPIDYDVETYTRSLTDSDGNVCGELFYSINDYDDGGRN